MRNSNVLSQAVVTTVNRLALITMIGYLASSVHQVLVKYVWHGRILVTPFTEPSPLIYCDVIV